MERQESARRCGRSFRRATALHAQCSIVLALALLVIVLALGDSIMRPQRVSAARLSALAPIANPDGRLGVCNVLPNTLMSGAVPWSRLATNAGARYNRWEFRWDRIEHARGILRWRALDAAVNSSIAGNIRILGILIATPRWASPTPWSAGNSVPLGLYRPIQSHRNLWAQYVRATVRHFKGRVHVWEVWNEPDLPFFWSGSPKDYARLLKVTYLAAHRIDQSIRIVMGGMASENMVFFRAVLSALRSDPTAFGRHDFFNIAAWHAYATPIRNYYAIERFRQYLRDAGLRRPIWITETGRPADIPDGEQAQAAYTLESIATALAAGASRVFAYRLSDYNEKRPWGLLRNDHQPRLAYLAFQTAARYFSHLYHASLSSEGNVNRLALSGQKMTVTLLWDDVEPSASVPLTAATGTIIHIDGTTQRPETGQASLIKITQFAPILLVAPTVRA